MPKVTGPDGVEREISMEEFLEAISQDGAQLVGVQQVVTDSKTGEEIDRIDIPQNKDGSFDLLRGGLFGGLFADNRTLEEKIRDAEDGDDDTMEELALLFLNGDDETDADPQKAVYWFTKLAELDDSDAQFNLGLHYAKGHGVERDFEKAAYWMEQAADNGDMDAPTLVEKYKKWAAASVKAETGDAQAMADLAAGLMEMGRSLEQAGEANDFAAAFELAQKSAAQNNGDGLWALALAYEHGRGVNQDVKKAIECYRKGAELGHAPSQHSLACYYMRGDTVKKDEALAIDLCRKSAEQGYNLAYFFLAKAYEMGNGVEEDLDVALEWGEKAAETGTPDIQYEIAKMYTYSDITGKMPQAARARYWLSKAADRGHEKAYSMLNFSPMWENAEAETEQDDRNLPEGYMDALDSIAASMDAGKDLDAALAELNGRRTDEIVEGDVGSVVCLVEGDQLKCWVQKVTVIRSTIPLEDMKLLFEMHNLLAGEYEKAAKDDMDVSYVGLYGLEDEAQEARRKLKHAAGVPKPENAGEDDKPMTVAELLKKYPDRYGHLNKYFDKDALKESFDLQSLNYRPAEEPQIYYWIDLTRVSEVEYERYTSELHHVYNVAELFAPGELPFDLNDPDTVSVFGTGKFEALADLSYGC